MDYCQRIILFGCLLIGLTACSGKPAGSRDLEVTSNFLVSQDFVGGAIVRVENPSNSTFTDYDLSTPPFVVSIADGVWNIYVLGVTSEGVAFCGGSSNLNLASDTASINISATEQNCDSAPYTTLKSKKIATWDQSLWDQAKWGP